MIKRINTKLFTFLIVVLVLVPDKAFATVGGYFNCEGPNCTFNFTNFIIVFGVPGIFFLGYWFGNKAK